MAIDIQNDIYATAAEKEEAALQAKIAEKRANRPRVTEEQSNAAIEKQIRSRLNEAELVHYDNVNRLIKRLSSVEASTDAALKDEASSLMVEIATELSELDQTKPGVADAIMDQVSRVLNENPALRPLKNEIIGRLEDVAKAA